MLPRLIIITIVITGALLFLARRVMASTNYYDESFRKYGNKYGVDWRLAKAVAIRESSLNSNAYNVRDPSYGIMQILCTPSINGTCGNKLPAVIGWPPKSRLDLYNADYNISIGVQILSWNISTYGLRKGIAVYNSWAARNETEPFSNQNYLLGVLKEYERLKNENP